MVEAMSQQPASLPEDSQLLANLVLVEAATVFQSQKKLAERAIVQLSDQQLRVPLDENTNSVAIIMKHLAGNMLSRWTDFLSSDGEKPWRHRDQEFVDGFGSRQEISEYWERGWACLFAALAALKPEDLARSVTVRGETLTVVGAIYGQLSHYGYHVGQIVQIARWLAKDNWTTLTIARGQSEQYNDRVWQGPRGDRPAL